MKYTVQFFVLTAFIFSSYISHAAESTKYDQQYKEYTSKASEIRASLDAKEAELKKLRASLEAQEKAVAAARTKSIKEMKDTSWFSDTLTEVDTGRYTVDDGRALNAATEQYQRIRDQVYSAIAQRDELQGKLAATKLEAIDAKEEASEIRAKFNAHLNLQSLDTNFNKLNRDLVSTNEMIQAIRAKYDQTILAAYLREKMTQMMDSKALCNMIKDTAKSGQCKAVDPKDMDAIFPKVPGQGRSGSANRPPGTGAQQSR